MYDDLSVEGFMSGLKKRNPDEIEFHQAVHEVAQSVVPYILDNPKYQEAGILQRMTEPDRSIIFRVVWEDDAGNIRVNRGYRVQFNNAIGPYKGGLRLHPSVNLSILKFLGFEQTFKNSLTTLPMGAGKGGSDFDPKGKSDREVMRFCQSFMTELVHHIGPHTDVPAGDIGVGAREISYMFGQYKRLSTRFDGALTGKAMEFGGSLGNVALYCAQKLMQLGAKVITLSDSGGFVLDPAGIDEEKLEWLIDLKTRRRGRLSEYAENYGLEFFPDRKPWRVPCDLAFPCATQNELGAGDALALVENGCKAVSEGANMPTTLEAIKVFRDAEILYGPGKAANAGGVAVSGLEMTQNSIRLTWTAEETEERLRDIMKKIHRQCTQHGAEPSGYMNYVKGANIAGFIKVADAMLAYGVG
jgi:glutamate dehydrogenase (NADP+)